MFDVKRMRSPEAAARSRAFGTSTGPIPVWIQREPDHARGEPLVGGHPEEHEFSGQARNVSNSASTAWAINRRRFAEFR